MPHYRKVDVLEELEEGRRVAMYACRGRIPIHWQAMEIADPSIPRITFVHIGGATNDMHVEWRFQSESPAGETPATSVTISHHLIHGRRFLVPRLTENLINRIFIDHIATLTLGAMKVRLENDG